MGQVGTISDQQLTNNYGALYGYATRVNLRNCAIVLVHSVFAELSTTASQWYSVCYLDSNKRPTTRIVAPCVYGSTQNQITACRIETNGQFQIYMGSSQSTRTYFTFAFGYIV